MIDISHLKYIKSIGVETDPHNPIDFVILENHVIGIDNECICLYDKKEYLKGTLDPIDSIDIPKPEKRFMCWWNPDSIERNSTSISLVDKDFFSIKNGYNFADIGDINYIAIGETVKLQNGDHIITRVQ